MLFIIVRLDNGDRIFTETLPGEKNKEVDIHKKTYTYSYIATTSTNAT